MLKATAVSIALLGWTTAALAQQCTASAQAPDATWSAAPPGPTTLPDAPLRIMSHLRCLGCKPEVSMLLTAGPASPALQTMPVIGKKTGMEWARAVVEDPANREGFRESVLRSELRSSPGCRLQGTVTGVAEIGNMGAIGTALQAECAQAPTKLSAEFYSAYDYNCEYQVQLIWGPGFVPLSPEGRAAVRELLKTVRFGRQAG
jgi:hypothetical protein